MTSMELVAVARWAEGHYPGRAGPPPCDLQGITPQETMWLLGRSTTRRSHLALVDQPGIRAHMKNPDVKAAARQSWRAKQAPQKVAAGAPQKAAQPGLFD